MSQTVKFVYVQHMGDEISGVKRGRFSVVHGAILPYFQPYHVDFSITSKSELPLKVVYVDLVDY